MMTSVQMVPSERGSEGIWPLHPVGARRRLPEVGPLWVEILAWGLLPWLGVPPPW